MKTVRKEAKVNPPKPAYPYLARRNPAHSEEDYVILFNAPSSGTVVHAEPQALHQVGAVSEQWAEDLFAPMPGHESVELRNKFPENNS